MSRALSRLSVSHMAAIAIGACIAASPPAIAQKPVGKDPVPSILTWTPKQQLERYTAIEKIYQSGTIKKGDKVRPLPAAATQIDPKIKVGGKTSALDAFMKDNRISGVIAVKDGQVVLEKYALGRKPEDKWITFSVAKSVTSILIGAAIRDGYISSIYDPVTKYIPELKGSAYDGVSLRRLMSMTTGVKWDENYASQKSDVARASQVPFKGGHPIENNPIVQYMATLKREAPAGEKWVYKTGETDLAGIALARALAGKSLSEYASEKLWKPYGMESDATWMLDKAGIERGGCCISATLRDYARIGLFMMGGGEIDGNAVLPAGYAEEATSNQLPKKARDQKQSYGYFWWPNENGYAAYGIYGQGIFVFPEDNLVIAVNAAQLKATDRTQDRNENALIEAIRTAANGG